MKDVKKAPWQDEAEITKSHSKDKHFKDQFEVVYKGFFEKPQTMKMLSERTRIDRANICWYCRDLRKAGKLVSVKKSFCHVTKHKANFWTTNPAFFPISSQLKLF